MGEFGDAWGALAVLAINLTVLVTVGSVTLILQRRFAPERK